MKRLITAIAIAASLVISAPAQAQREPSLYLRCDGKPNNTTDMESFARLVGAVTLLGLFAPSPETPDPEAREFGEAGVAACSALIDGERAEGNVIRRIPLILARAVHRIEAKDYQGALTDIGLARAEAEAAGLVGNPYFDRSMGMGFDRLESVAYLRLEDYDGAREAVVRSGRGHDYHTFAMLLVYTIEVFVDDIRPEEDRQMAALARAVPTYSMHYALRLDDVGRHADAARVRRDFLAFLETVEPGAIDPTHFARAALSEALAGEWVMAERHYDEAWRIIRGGPRPAAPDRDPAPAIEVLDLVDVVRLIHEGDLDNARLNFGARSRWSDPSFGAVVRLVTLLREGAGEDELNGMLARTAEELWEERRGFRRAVDLEQDADNSWLFSMIPSYADIDAYEDESREVYRLGNRSRMLADEPFREGTDFYYIHSDTPRPVRNPAMMLHAALQARDQGRDGFAILTFMPLANGQGVVDFIDRDDLGEGNMFFIDAESVIAELGELIPSPDEVRARQRERRRNR